MPQLIKLQQGLDSCGILESARKHPKPWEPVFKDIPGSQVKTEEFLKNLIATFSESQLLKDKEIAVHKHFTRKVK